MRLPVEPASRLPVPRNPLAIQRKPAVARVSRVAVEAATAPAQPPPLPPRREPPRFAQGKDRPVETDATPPSPSEQRRYCRRVTKQPILPDTRSGEDRRYGAWCESDWVPSVDEEV